MLASAHPKRVRRGEGRGVRGGEGRGGKGLKVIPVFPYVRLAQIPVCLHTCAIPYLPDLRVEVIDEGSRVRSSVRALPWQAAE